MHESIVKSFLKNHVEILYPLFLFIKNSLRKQLEIVRNVIQVLDIFFNL